MNKTNRRRAIVSVACAVAVAAGWMSARNYCRADNAPAGAPAAQPAARSAQQIVNDIEATSQGLQPILSNPKIMIDPKARVDAAPKAIPLLKRMIALANEAAKNSDLSPMMRDGNADDLKLTLIAFDDKDTLAAATADTASSDAKTAAVGKRQLLFHDWIGAAGDAAAQTRVADRADAMAKSDPADSKMTMQLMLMAGLSSSPDLRQHVKDIAAGMKTPMAQALAARMEVEKKLHAFENKPLTITGTTVDGKPFSTADWKGKVVLVDFWATWCGPCREELPRVKKAYADFHAKGLEILGVSNDYDAKALSNFVAADPGMPWPELFDGKAAANQEWNPITTGFGIDGIPTMFLIDKKGVLRTVEAREDFEQRIPQMLDEK